MRVTESQLRKIVREEIEGAMGDEELHVVIGNRGRGSQELYPSSKEPKAYTPAEAAALVRRLSANSGYYTIAWHSKPISQAEEFITPGQDASYGLMLLMDEIGGMK